MRGKNGGPKTSTGKAVVSRNATKHGLTSLRPVIIEDLETVADWERHRDGIVESLAPEGYLEQELAERIASLLWRLRRVTRHETAVVRYQVGKTDEDRIRADAYFYGVDAIIEQAEGKRDDVPEPTPEEMQTAREMRIIPWKDQLTKITRYETTLHRLWVQTLHELEALQSRRRGERPHLARLDISSPPPA